MAAKTKPEPKVTEADMLAMLRAKLTKSGTGGAGEYALLPHVRDGAGFTAGRTIDAVAVSLWPSRGFAIHGYEIKCSRSDWLRELKEPAKAEAAAAFCDHFSIVVPTGKIVGAGELPPTWGLLVAHGARLVVVKPAPLLPGADPKRPISRHIMVTMLRSAGAKVAASPAEVQAAREEGAALERSIMERAIQHEREDLAELRGKVKAFEDAAGVSFSQRWGGRDPAKVGAALRVVLAGDGATEAARKRVEGVRLQLQTSLDAIDKVLGPDGS